MKLSECRFKQVSMGGIKSSIELMDELISEKFDLLVIDPAFSYTSVVRPVTNIEEQMGFLIKFRSETTNRQVSDEAEFYVGHYGLIETLEPIT